MILTRREVVFVTIGLTLFPTAALCGGRLNHWRQRLAKITFQNSICHRTQLIADTGGGLQFTFSVGELAQRREQGNVDLIVHHGVGLPLKEYLALYSHHEALTIFASPQAGVSFSSVSNVRKLISGQIKNWAHVGGKDMEVQVLFHGGEINKRALESILGGAGIVLAPSALALRSYEELVSAANTQPGALVLGLRSDAVRNSGLLELSVNGVRAAGPNAESYPLQSRITVFIRRSEPRAVKAGSEFIAELEKRAREDGVEAKMVPVAERIRNSLDVASSGRR
jgi:hypothetical protein